MHPHRENAREPFSEIDELRERVGALEQAKRTPHCHACNTSIRWAHVYAFAWVALVATALALAYWQDIDGQPKLLRALGGAFVGLAMTALGASTHAWPMKKRVYNLWSDE